MNTEMQSLSYQTRLDVPVENLEPDTFSLNQTDAIRPSADFVISRKQDGSVLSLYGDSTFWDLEVYATTVSDTGKLYWDKIPGNTVDDAKWVTFILLYMVSSGHTGTLSVGTLANYQKVIKKLCVFSEKMGSPMLSVLQSVNLVSKFVHSEIAHTGDFSYFVSLLKHLLVVGSEHTGIRPLNVNAIEELRGIRATLAEPRQHSVIPPRILSSFLNELWALINGFVKVNEQLLPLLQQCSVDTKYGRGKKNSFLTVLAEHNLTDFFLPIGVHCIQALHSYLLAVQDAGRHLLHAYSGMRYNEVLSLKVDCLSIETGKHGRIARLLGKTTKFVGQRKPAAWVTSKEVETVISALQTIAKAIAYKLNVDPKTMILLPSPSYLRFVGQKPKSLENISPHNYRKTSLWRFVSDKNLIIEEQDLRFLEKIDEQRAWREEADYQIGIRWRFSTHQFRRSLAYYCRQSGIVKLTSLKRQLKHITREMTLYYANGSEFGELFSGKEHFLREYERSREEADALAYILDILLSEERLFGAQGNHIERYERFVDEDVVLQNRKKIVERFKKGELAYQETALGACTSVKPCDKKLAGVISACIKCSNAVLKASKLEKTIEQQKLLISSLNPESIEFRTEENELTALLAEQTKIDKVIKNDCN